MKKAVKKSGKTTNVDSVSNYGDMKVGMDCVKLTPTTYKRKKKGY